MKERGKASHRKRTGCIYSEFTNKGRSSVRYVRGSTPVHCFRWVGEICIGGKRHRFRSTNLGNVRFRIDTMIARGELWDKEHGGVSIEIRTEDPYMEHLRDRAMNEL